MRRSSSLLIVLTVSAAGLEPAFANPALAGAIAGSMAPFFATASSASVQRITTDSAWLSLPAATQVMQGLGFKPTRYSDYCFSEPTFATSDGATVCFYQRPFLPDRDTTWQERDGLWPDSQSVSKGIFHARVGFAVHGKGSFPAESMARAIMAGYIREISPHQPIALHGYDTLSSIPASGYWGKAAISSIWSLHHAMQGNFMTEPYRGAKALLYGAGGVFDLLSWTPMIIGLVMPDLTVSKRAGLIAIGATFRLTFNFGFIGMVGNELMNRHNRFAEAGLDLPRFPPETAKRP
jgi:hypothetical protein